MCASARIASSNIEVRECQTHSDKTQPGNPSKIPRAVPPSEVSTVQSLVSVQWDPNFKKESNTYINIIPQYIYIYIYKSHNRSKSTTDPSYYRSQPQTHMIRTHMSSILRSEHSKSVCEFRGTTKIHRSNKTKIER